MDDEVIRPSQYKHLPRSAIAIVLAGVVFRLILWAWQQPFWTDEASLLLNIISKTARQLWGPLIESQAAPPLHLMLLRASYVLLGDSPLALRLGPLLLSMVALVVFARLAWAVLPKPEALLAIALFAFSDRVIWHAVEVKQYAGDAMVAAVLLWMALGWRRTLPAGTRVMACAVVASGLMWLSHAALFLFASISLAFLPTVWKQRAQTVRWLAGNALFGLSAAGLFVLSIRVQRSPALVEVWVNQFVPWRHPARIPLWLARGIIGLCDYPAQGLGGTILTLLAFIGSVHLWRTHQKQRLAVLALPIALLLLAAGAWVFPFNGNRVTFFTAPSILLLAGYGAAHLRKVLRGTWKSIGDILLGVMAVEMLGLAMIHVVRPEPRTHILPVIDYLKRNRTNGEGIYVVGMATRTMFIWYWRGRSGPVLFKDEHGPELPIPWSRFWVVGIYPPRHGIKDIQPDLNYAGAFAKEVERYQGDGSAAVLFQRRASGPVCRTGAPAISAFSSTAPPGHKVQTAAGTTIGRRQ